MNKEFSTASDSEFLQGLEDSFVSYKQGKRIKGFVLSANENGIDVAIGGKHDGLIKKDEVEFDREYDPANYPKSMPIEANKHTKLLFQINKKAPIL